MRRVDTVIVGGGQAGLALSRVLTLARRDHVVLERGRIGERWRSERWDSLRLLTPNWMNALPGDLVHADPDGYLDRAGFVGYLERYAASFAAPVVEHATVRRVRRAGRRLSVDVDTGRWLADNVVVATGDCDLPHVPAVAMGAPDGVAQVPAARYRRPGALAPGAVLVVGGGPSGQQIALELRRAGRDVVLATGRHARMPRRYRGRDVWAWFAELGELERPAGEVHGRGTPNLPLSGNGEDLDLGLLRAAGVVVTGRLTGFDGAVATFDAEGLAGLVGAAEQRMDRVLARIDAHIAARCPGAPTQDRPAPVGISDAPASLHLRRGGVSTIVWATGYRRTYPWLRMPVVDLDGEIVHRGGITPVPGLSVLGRRLQRRRSSHLIGGVGADAEWLAGRLSQPRAQLLRRAA